MYIIHYTHHLDPNMPSHYSKIICFSMIHELLRQCFAGHALDINVLDALKSQAAAAIWSVDMSRKCPPCSYHTTVGRYYVLVGFKTDARQHDDVTLAKFVVPIKFYWVLGWIVDACIMHIRMYYTTQWLGHGIVIVTEVVNTPQASSSLGVLLGLSREGCAMCPRSFCNAIIYLCFTPEERANFCILFAYVASDFEHVLLHAEKHQTLSGRHSARRTSSWEELCLTREDSFVSWVLRHFKTPLDLKSTSMECILERYCKDPAWCFFLMKIAIFDRFNSSKDAQ